jgi:hypothetical protein
MPRPRITDRLTCKHGHPWVEENIYTTPSGYKTCKTCAREANHRQRKDVILERRRKARNERLSVLLSLVEDDIVLSVRDFKQMIADLCD